MKTNLKGRSLVVHVYPLHSDRFMFSIHDSFDKLSDVAYVATHRKCYRNLLSNKIEPIYNSLRVVIFDNNDDSFCSIYKVYSNSYFRKLL